MGSNNQYRLLWSGISRSKKIKQIQGDRWLRLGCHLVYTWLQPWADDDGRLIGDPLWVLANVVPYEGLNQKEIKQILIELHRVNLIYWYEVENEYFIQINRFKDHQRIRQDRYKPSSYPSCQPDVGQVSDKCQPDVGLSPSPSPSPSPSKDIVEQKTRLNIPYQEIIEYLNQKANKHFKHTSKETQNFIKARWNQGFKLDAFKFVIDIKCKKWLTEPKMIDYLRPQTLFGTKFESYLNETTHPLHGKVSDKTIQSIEALNEWEQKENEKQG